MITINQNTTPVRDYLTKKGISFKETNEELLVKCLFGDCDKNSRPNEYHLYISTKPHNDGQYDCKKCGAKGNIFTLADHFGDDKTEVIDQASKRRNSNSYSPSKLKQAPEKSYIKIPHEEIETYQKALPEDVRLWLNERGINDEVIQAKKIGWGKFYKKD